MLVKKKTMTNTALPMLRESRSKEKIMKSAANARRVQCAANLFY